MRHSLIPKNEFIGIGDAAHLSAGGETPMLRSHLDAIARFANDKAAGEPARTLEDDMATAVRGQCAEFFGGRADDYTFLSNASEGINNLAYALDWERGDNVVIIDVEFPSGILPWTRLQEQGVEVRVVQHNNWYVSIDDIAALIDERTRVVHLSQVSMFTGQRMDVEKISALVRASNAIFSLDATHAAGVMPVDATLADVMMSSCYKWLLGVHGVAVFYVNSETLPDFKPPFLGWASPQQHGGWQDPLAFELREDAHRFQPGNPSYIGIYILNNALRHLLDIGISRISEHALALSGEILAEVDRLGFELMTPGIDAERAGNVCFMADNMDALQASLTESNVLIWGAYAGFGRLRASTHLYNDSDDVDRCIAALRSATRG